MTLEINSRASTIPTERLYSEGNMPGKTIDELLKELFACEEIPSTLKSGESYERVGDDNGGKREPLLSVYFDQGDVFLYTDRQPGQTVRFRSYFGGGHSLRVRAALFILAEAIRLDNLEEPQEF